MEDKDGPRFNGPEYVPAIDQSRLRHQIGRIFMAMQDGHWRTLNEIHEITRDPQASISAQLRHFRKPRFGSHEVVKRRRGDAGDGLWEYRLVARGDLILNHRSAA